MIKMMLIPKKHKRIIFDSHIRAPESSKHS